MDKFNSLQILKKIQNLGPITDLCVVDQLDKNSTEIFTCSGGAKDSCFGLIRSGNSCLEHGGCDFDFECVGLYFVFDFLFVSFIFYTRGFAFKNSLLTEIEDYNQLIINSSTVFASGVTFNKKKLIVQVTDTQVILLDLNLKIIDHKSVVGVTLAQVFNNQLYICKTGGELEIFSIATSKLIS